MADMEICDEPADIKKCFKTISLDNLNVVYNASTSMFVFWNKYELFLHENFDLKYAARVLIPEFTVYHVIISNNYLICLDCKANVHVISLKFKNTQKRLKTNFQPREQNILAFVQQDENVLSLKYESETYFICLNKIDSSFQSKRKIPIRYEDKTWPLPKTSQEKCLITAFKAPSNDENIKQLFNLQDSVHRDCYIVILTLDKLNVFACFFNPNEQDNIKLIKLYSCPSEICNIQVIVLEELNLVMVLNSGSVIKLLLKKSAPSPVPVHLNTAVSKFVTFKDILLYTDGASMWKTENTFTKIRFTQFFIRHVKDFVRFGDQIVCTTYSGMIYLIPDDETSYLKPESELYCPAEKLLNNSEYLYKLLEEVDKNNELIKRLSEEGNYITALALCNRQDLMESILKNNIVVYEHYEDAVKESPDLTIIEDLNEYFKAESLHFLIKIKVIQMEHLVNQVLGQLFQNSKLHVSLFSEYKLLKTNTIKMTDSLNKLNILIPVEHILMSDTSVIKANIKIITQVPGAFNSKEPVWATLYKKEIILNSEHFIKSDLISNRTKSLKDPQESIEELIAKTTSNQHGNLFKINETSNNTELPEFSMYVKLPVNYTDLFKSLDLTSLNKRKSDYLSKQLSSEEFLKSSSNLTFEVGRHKVDIEIVTDEMPLLKVTSRNISKALSLRNFFADLLYGDYKLVGSDVQFVDYGVYTVVENLQKATKDSMDNSNSQDLESLAEQFQKTVLGALPV